MRTIDEISEECENLLDYLDEEAMTAERLQRTQAQAMLLVAEAMLCCADELRRLPVP